VTHAYREAENEDLSDEEAEHLWELPIGSRRPRDPLAYLAKIFGGVPDLDTLLAKPAQGDYDDA
jgi:hypothetical protein